MSGRLAAGRLIASFRALVLGSCASGPEPVAPPEQPAASPAPARAAHPRPPPPTELPLEQRERETAERLMQEGRWAEAIPHWEVLELLHPDQPTYAKKLADAKARAGSAAAEHLQQARQAREQGQNDRAFLLYLRVLSADPDSAEAAQALRDIEKDSARRAYVGALSRGGNNEAMAGVRRGSNGPPPPSVAERGDLDSAIMLLHQGETVAAVQALEGYVRKNPRDDLGRRTLQDAYAELARQRSQEGKKEEALTYLDKAQALRDVKSNPGLARSIKSLRKELAEDYYQQGLRAERTDLSEAISDWEKTLKYDPDHPLAAQRLERAHRMQQNLRSIQDINPTP
jgi:tetratricopeptide (TPR) repeat protein